PIALRSAGDSLLGILASLISRRSQPLWIPLSTENRTNDSHASDPGDVRDHLRELYVHLLEGLLHVADMVGGISHQHGTLAKITPQHADLVVGPECPPTEAQRYGAVGSTGSRAHRSFALARSSAGEDRPASPQNHAR